ncbi:hypothetical protein PpBr36_07854 [Pyricularia pennisetigena]|uniref:hypothetical protein n=1 Tax=Pyricularia pennisetigena TaxID=1578925 RepID=UPI00114F86C8|nr:hypothetical protein PpBr36_07854 [Pyricularia pennisetigena]TLS25995.1 hypothetical protein PpBr36_07854 [Pyricularia pennisetigena]
MSRFVSAGAIDAATGEVVSADDQHQQQGGEAGSSRKQEWSAVSRELDEQRKRREEEARRIAEEGAEPSLFAILQANKAAKQAAFEEANKIKNQFRALDEDEIEFLDEVAASKRAEEERTRKEVEEGLDRFRELQQLKSKDGGGDGGAEEDGGDGDKEDWSFGTGAGARKRRRKDDGGGLRGLKGVVRRKTEQGAEKKDPGAGDVASEKVESVDGPAKSGEKPAAGDKTVPPVQAETPVTNSQPKPNLGLVAYGSDDDSD